MEEWNNGENQQGNMPVQNPVQNTLDNFEKSDQGKKKKKGFLALKIALAVVVVLVIAAVVVFTQPTLRNQMYLTFLSPKAYFLKTELANFGDSVEKVADIYEKSLKNLEQQKEGSKKSELGIKLDIGKTYKSLLGLNDVLPVEFLMDTTLDAENFKEKAEMELKLGNESLIGLNLLMNMGQEDKSDIYIQVPKLSESYLYTSLEEDEEDVDAETKKEMETYQKAYGKFLKDPTARKFLVNFITRYGKIIIEGPEQVALEKKADYTVNGNTKKMTKVTVTITGEDAIAWTNKILAAMKEDEDLKKEMVRLEICKEEEYSALIETMKKEFEESGDEPDEGKIAMDVWVDKKGSIIGREFHLIEDSGKETCAIAYRTDNQDGIGYLEAEVTDNSEDQIRSITINGNRKKEENGYKGEAVFKVKKGNEPEIGGTLSFDGVQETTDSCYNGNFIYSWDKSKSTKLKCTLAGEENKQNVAFEFIMKNQSLCSLEINSSIKDGEKIVYPPEGKTYDINDENNLMTYLGELNQEELEKLQDKIGNIGEIISSITGNDELGETFSEMIPAA